MATLRRNAVGAAAAVLVLSTVVGLTTPAPAGASCSGPTASHDLGTFDRGATLIVVGSGFGDDCYDTGGPPAGVGVLGKPLDHIEVLVVQGGVEHRVAEGAADGEYGFSVEVVLPAELEPGEADVVVLYGVDGVADDPNQQPFTVSDVEPGAPAASSPEVATFGPVETEPEVVQVPGDGDEGEARGEGEVTTRGGDDPPLGFFIASGVLALGAVAALLLLRKRQSSILDGDGKSNGDGDGET